MGIGATCPVHRVSKSVYAIWLPTGDSSLSVPSLQKKPNFAPVANGFVLPPPSFFNGKPVISRHSQWLFPIYPSQYHKYAQQAQSNPFSSLSLSLSLLPSLGSAFRSNCSRIAISTLLPRLLLDPFSVTQRLSTRKKRKACSWREEDVERETRAKMAFWSGGFLNNELSRKTAVFGLRLWVVIGICVGASIVLVLFFLSLCLSSCCCRRRRRSPSIAASSPRKKPQKPLKQHLQDPAPTVSKDIAEIHHHNQTAAPDVRIDVGKPDHPAVLADHRHQESNNNNRHRPKPPAGPPSASTTGTASGETTGTPSSMGGGGGPPEVSHLGWGHWYTLRELEEATDGLAPENVIGEGGYGIVYRGVLADNTTVAIKNLLNNRGQAEKEFKVEVEAIGRVRHKNLVRLLGYCVEGAYRMLVYEYVDNGNLEQWLHGDVGEMSPLTWDIRMNIILGTAKGLAYLHEGLEPKVVHRDIKASNILLDQHWNAKVSDFGLAKLLCSERTYVTTRVMGTFGYVAPEYASTGMLNERSDIYSFGILIMEIISGRSPVDYTRPPGEVNLIDWLKLLVSERRSEQMVDPKMPEKPSAKALKRILLVALRCVDPDAHKRPKMGHVIHMLEMDDLLGREERKMDQESSAARPSSKGYTGEEEGGFHKRDHRLR